jgi:hypothetical protein
MSNEQAALTSDAARIAYAADIMTAGAKSLGQQWYADNSREPIRDETLRNGFLLVGAITALPLPTTSSKPRYALKGAFAALFDPTLMGDDLARDIARWQTAHLNKNALARIQLVGLTQSPDDFLVTFPNGETRSMGAGVSSMISKQVIEGFARRYLEKPGVLWLSESGNKVVQRDDILAKKIGLNIDPSKNLPDIILVDLGGEAAVLVFVEVVKTDGPISEQRRAELLRLATVAGLEERHVAFVTAFLDRESASLRKSLPDLAWNSFVWIASEPEHLIHLVRGPDLESPLLRDLMGRGER